MILRRPFGIQNAQRHDRITSRSLQDVEQNYHPGRLLKKFADGQAARRENRDLLFAGKVGT
jgi:hypothetical protein